MPTFDGSETEHIVFVAMHPTGMYIPATTKEFRQKITRAVTGKISRNWGMTRRKHDPSRSLAFLFLLLCILLPHVALSQRLEACHACVPTSVRNQAAIGFDLGQSYG